MSILPFVAMQRPSPEPYTQMRSCGPYLLASKGGGYIDAMDRRTFKGRRTIPIAGGVLALASDPAGGVCVLGDRSIYSVLLPVLRPKRVLALPDRPYSTIAVNGRGDFAIGDFEGGVTLFVRLAKGGYRATYLVSPRPTALPSRAASVLSLAFSPNGKRLAVGGKDELSIWSFRDRKRIGRFPIVGKRSQYAYDVKFSPSGRLLAGLSNGEISIIEADGRSTRRFRSTGRGQCIGVLSLLGDIVGGIYATSADRRNAADDAVAFFSAKGRQLYRVALPAAASAFTASPDGTEVYIGLNDGEIRRFERPGDQAPALSRMGALSAIHSSARSRLPSRSL